jgi:hypothetical protein
MALTHEFLGFILGVRRHTVSLVLGCPSGTPIAPSDVDDVVSVDSRQADDLLPRNQSNQYNNSVWRGYLLAV